MNKKQIVKKIENLRKSNERNLFHDLCLVFPFSKDLVIALVKDIEQNGQVEPITKYNGKILDGRHRWYACKILGILPKFIEIDHSIDPKAYVKSKNFKRRDLSPGQRIIIALDLDEWKPIEVNEKQLHEVKKELKHDKQISDNAESTPTTVRKVKKILIAAEKKPDIEKIVKKLKDKKISVDTAYRKVLEPKKTIKQIKKEKEPIEKELNKVLRKKYSELLFVYNFVKRRCEELGYWDEIFRGYRPKNNEPTMEQLRKSELWK